MTTCEVYCMYDCPWYMTGNACWIVTNCLKTSCTSSSQVAPFYSSSCWTWTCLLKLRSSGSTILRECKQCLVLSLTHYMKFFWVTNDFTNNIKVTIAKVAFSYLKNESWSFSCRLAGKEESSSTICRIIIMVLFFDVAILYEFISNNNCMVEIRSF